jgi:hypothetical protein
VSKQQEPLFHTDWVEALDTFTTDTPTVGIIVKRGTRYPVDNPVVQIHPKMFCDDHLTREEKGRLYAERFYREPANHEPTTLLPAPLRDEDAVVAIKSRVAYAKDAHGTLVPRLDNYLKGQKFPRNHPIPREYPEDFEPVVRPQAEPLVKEA